MNRRGFLAALLGLAAAPIAAMLPEVEEPLLSGFIPVAWYVKYAPVILNEYWIGRIESFSISNGTCQ